MNFEMYYSTETDHVAPQIVDPGPSAVLHQETDDGLRFTVGAADDEALFRVLITYSDELGRWKSLDLDPDANNPSVWRGLLEDSTAKRYLVQAIDTAGNCSVLSIVSDDMNGASEPWGTETSAPRLFTIGNGSAVVGHGRTELAWSVAGLVLLGVLTVKRARRARGV